MSRKSKIVGSIIGAFILIGIIAFYVTDHKTYGKMQYNLEVIIPDTGNMAYLGDPVKNALIMAQEELKDELSQKNISLNLIFGDSQGNPKTAVTIYNQNKSLKKIHGVFSYMSGPTLAIKPLAQQDNILMIAATVDPSITFDSKNLIRPYYSFGSEGTSVLKVVEEKKPKKVAVIYSTDPATAYEVEKIVIPGINKIGIPCEVQSYKVGERDFRNQVVIVKLSKPEMILTYGFGSDLPFLINTLREQKAFDGIFVTGPIGIADALPSQTTKPFAGMYYFGPAFLLEEFEKGREDYRAFKAKYIQKYGADKFTLSAVYAYDSLRMLAQSIMSTNTTDASILFKEIIAKHNKGLAGEYSFDNLGNSNPSVGFAYIDKEGHIKLVREFK